MTRAVVFAYSEVGYRCVRELLAQHVEIPLLFTHTDDPREHHWFGSVLELANSHGVQVVTPTTPNLPEWLAEGRAAAPDFIFSFYYRHMLEAGWLTLAHRGALNMHGSLLPKYRGRAPVHWAILKGETETGASLHYMEEKPDAGALVDQEPVTIRQNDTALDVSMKVAAASERLLQRSLPRLIEGSAMATPLDLSQGSYFGRRTPEDGRINWQQDAQTIHDLVRSVAPPFPGAFTEVDGHRLGIYETRVDGDKPRYPALAPCLYTANDRWYVDCTDGKRLKILQFAVNDALVAQNMVPPALMQQPVTLLRGTAG